MGISKELQQFVDRALEKGLSRPEITDALTSAGWQREEVGDALAAYHDLDFPVPVPKKRHSLTARDTVFYLFLFITLYVVSWGLIALAFDIIDLTLPGVDPYPTQESLRSGIRYWVAYSAVFTPVYLVLAWKAERRHKLDPTCPLSTSRQWLTYVTLFIASMTMLGDLVALLYAYLSGDLSLRLLLKICVVAVIAGMVILYYYSDMQRAEKGRELNSGL